MMDWLEEQAIRSAQHLLSLDPALLSPAGRSLLPYCEEILEVPDNVVSLR
jgi:hypothetical protein